MVHARLVAPERADWVVRGSIDAFRRRGGIRNRGNELRETGLRLDLSAAGVRVTEIVAGRVESPLYKDVLPAEARAAMYAGQTAVRPEDVAAMVLAVLNLPPHVDVARFDILPTRQPVSPQVPAAEKSK